MNRSHATITLGMQTSGEDARTNAPILQMRLLLAEHCRGPYSPEVDEFALVFRVGGEMQEFKFEGCERIRRSRKHKYITLDLGFPSNRWKGATEIDICKFIAEAVETGLLCFLRRLEKDKAEVNSAKLMSDYARVKKIFLASIFASGR